MDTRLIQGLTVIAFLTRGCSAMNHSDTTKPASAVAHTPANPLLAPWTGPYGGVPPWDESSPERYKQALRRDALFREA